MGQLIPFLDLTRQHRRLQSEIENKICRVMAEARFILGPEVAAFEKEFAHFCRVHHGIGVASGTDALELALRAVGIGLGDFVVTVSFTFLSTAEAILKVGARPIFVDVDPLTYTLDTEQLGGKIKSFSRAVRKRIRAIIPVHLYGHPCHMTVINTIARREGWFVIEDCAQAQGALWDSQPVGGLGDIGCFSFYPTKNLGGYGDGGMLVTSSKKLADRLRILRCQGRNNKEQQIMEGRNSRLDELQAAILRVKFKHLTQWIQQRRRCASIYFENLYSLPIQLPYELPGACHAYCLYSIQVSNRPAVQKELVRHGIGSAIYYRIPIHRQPLYRRYALGLLPVTDRVSRRILSLPIFPELSNAEIERVCRALSTIYS